MRKSKFFLLVIFLCFSSLSYSYEYTITKITDNSTQDAGPEINDNGWITWDQYVSKETYNCFFYDGTTIERITTTNTVSSQINNNGYVVMQGSGSAETEETWGIYLYDGYSVAKISGDLTYNKAPKINNNNSVVWYASDGNDYEIYQYNGIETIQITNNDTNDTLPQINDNGMITWQGGGSIFLYDGANTTQIGSGRRPSIGNGGYVAWESSGSREIYLYDGLTTTNLTNGNYGGYNAVAKVNSNGYVVWNGYESYGRYDILMYDGNSIINLTDSPDEDDRHPEINDMNWVTWEGGSWSWHYAQDKYEIFVYDGIDITQVTLNDFQDHKPMINENGDITWYGGYDGGRLEIYTSTAILIPEPSTIILLCLGLISGLLKKKK